MKQQSVQKKRSNNSTAKGASKAKKQNHSTKPVSTAKTTPDETKQLSRSEAALERLHQGVAELIQSDNWQAALKFKAKFYNYSFFNSMLIMSQCPHASLVAGYRKWQELGRQVKQGEKGLVILAPLMYSTNAGKDRDGSSAEQTPSQSSLASKPASTTAISSPASSKQESVLTDAGMKTLVGFRSVYVFDVSQTDGEALPQLQRPRRLENSLGDEGRLQLAITKLLAFSAQKGVKVSFDLSHTEALGCYFPRSHSIALKNDLSTLQTLKTFVHELAHALLHDLTSSRVGAELEAESCAYLVCHGLGLDSSQYSFPYLANWADSLDALLAAGEKASRAAEQVLAVFEPKDGFVLIEE